MSKDEVADVVALWQEEYTTLSQHKNIDNVLIFENKGKAIGVSNPHPHGQIYATGFVPKIVQRELDSFVDYKKSHSAGLLEDLVKYEQEKKDRIILENDHFIAFIPFFARFVYETYIVPKRHVSNISQLTKDETEAFVEIHKNIITKFDNLYKMSFPNITMLQNAPTDGKEENELFHFHVEFYPPMRSPDKLKYLAGFESGGGNIINPVRPEEAAGRMREASLVHYLA
jgi:UDPglucose--hexose-1-phosphate uridylyltransferase